MTPARKAGTRGITNIAIKSNGESKELTVMAMTRVQGRPIVTTGAMYRTITAMTGPTAGIIAVLIIVRPTMRRPGLM